MKRRKINRQIELFFAVLFVAMLFSCERKIPLITDGLGENVVVLKSERVKYYVPKKEINNYAKNNIGSYDNNIMVNALIKHIDSSKSSIVTVRDSMSVTSDTLVINGLDSVLVFPDWKVPETSILHGLKECVRYLIPKGRLGIWDEQKKQFVDFIYYKKRVTDIATEVTVCLPDGTVIINFLEQIR